MFFECKFLDLPRIPEELVKDIQPSEIIRNYVGRDITRYGVAIHTADNPFYRISAELESWIQENICKEYNDVGVRYAYGSPESPTTGIHTDETRRYVLMYNLHNGGGNLNFWQEWGHTVVRDRRVVIDNTEKVLRIDQFETPNNVWYLIDARILHSVENMTSTRINIQVSLDYDHFK